MERGCQRKWRLPCGTGTATESLREIPNIQPAENQDWSPSLPDEFGPLVGRDESEPVELVGVGLQALYLRTHLHWFGWRPSLDVLVLHFFIATDNANQLCPLVLVYFIVVVEGSFTCMACYFTDDIARLDRILQFWHQCFPHAVVRQLLICLETGGHGFHDMADGILSHSNFGVRDIWWHRNSA